MLRAASSVAVVAPRQLRWDALAAALADEGLIVSGPTLDVDQLPADVDAVVVAATDDDAAALVALCERRHPAATLVALVAREGDRSPSPRATALCLDDPVSAVVAALAGARPTRRRTRLGEPATDDAESLTARETEILQLMATGLRNGDVAARLNISPHTVRSHLQRIHSKLGVTTRLAAVTAARRAGLLQRSDQAG